MSLYFDIFFSAVIMWGIFHEVYVNKRNLKFVLDIWSQFSIVKFIEVTLATSAVLIGYLVIRHYLPFLDWSWTTLIGSNSANINFAPIAVYHSVNVNTTNTNIVSQIIKVISSMSLVLFLLAFVLVLPFLAKQEEEMFRKGHHTTVDIIKWSFIFGIVHVIVGIPIAIAISMTIFGLFLSYKYNRKYQQLKMMIPENRVNLVNLENYANEKAIIHSTVYHTLWNTTVLSLIILIEIYLMFK